MKVAITSTGKELDSNLDRRFGRCGYFLVVDTDSKDVEIIDNSAIAAGGGAGIAAAQQLIDRKVNVLITGNVGPNAFQTLNGAGVNIYTGQIGRISELVDLFEKGELERTDAPNVGGHHGMS